MSFGTPRFSFVHQRKTIETGLLNTWSWKSILIFRRLGFLWHFCETTIPPKKKDRLSIANVLSKDFSPKLGLLGNHNHHQDQDRIGSNVVSLVDPESSLNYRLVSFFKKSFKNWHRAKIRRITEVARLAYLSVVIPVSWSLGPNDRWPRIVELEQMWTWTRFAYLSVGIPVSWSLVANNRWPCIVELEQITIEKEFERRHNVPFGITV